MDASSKRANLTEAEAAKAILAQPDRRPKAMHHLLMLERARFEKIVLPRCLSMGRLDPSEFLRAFGHELSVWACRDRKNTRLAEGLFEEDLLSFAREYQRRVLGALEKQGRGIAEKLFGSGAGADRAFLWLVHQVAGSLLHADRADELMAHQKVSFEELDRQEQILEGIVDGRARERRTDLKRKRLQKLCWESLARTKGSYSRVHRTVLLVNWVQLAQEVGGIKRMGAIGILDAAWHWVLAPRGRAAFPDPASLSRQVARDSARFDLRLDYWRGVNTGQEFEVMYTTDGGLVINARAHDESEIPEPTKPVGRIRTPR